MAELALDREYGRSLRTGFLRSAAARPDDTALHIGERTWSYGELEHKARIWSQALLAALGRTPQRVGILGARSEVSYTGTLAALFAGATFVPLNPSFPPERTSTMAELADLDAIIVEERHLERLDTLSSAGKMPAVVLVPDASGPFDSIQARVLDRDDLARLQPLTELAPVLSLEIAYLLFTSGSTGVPKGVPVMHSNVLHFLDVMAERYRFTADDRVSQTFDQTFDLSVFDLFMAWEAGASVHVPSPIELVAPAAYINRNALTVWFSVPSIPALMRKKDLLKPASLPTLRWSLFCGEPLPRETAQAWQAAAPDSVVENLYGPTELTIACFAYRWDASRSPAQCVHDVVPIGRPYPGLGAVVVDDDRAAVEDGQPGELLVCGPQTVPGYWRDPQRTAERFVELQPHGMTVDRPATFYATGDRVARDAEGCYAYLGRTDAQIKLHGYRVELGEIEAVLRGVDGVVEAVAEGWPVQDGVIQGIVVFVSGAELSSDAIVARAREKLPSYMVPAQVTLVEQMPLNVNGKIDRRALTEALAGG